jgi:hypothetical protein
MRVVVLLQMAGITLLLIGAQFLSVGAITANGVVFALGVTLLAGVLAILARRRAE